MTIASGQQALAADILKSHTADGYLQLTDSTELTIASGAVTVTANFYRVDTESNASTDDLDTITAGTGVSDGHILILRAENAARTVIITHNAGNVMCRNGQNIILDDSEDWALLIYDSNLTKWTAMVGPQSLIYRRQSGSATNWSSGGTNNYSPLAPRFQAGAADLTISGGTSTNLVTVTFPAAFTQVPMVLATIFTMSRLEVVSLEMRSNSTTGVEINAYRAGTTGSNAMTIQWLAIGE